MPRARHPRIAKVLLPVLAGALHTYAAAPLPEEVKGAMQDGYSSTDPQVIRRTATVLEKELRRDKANPEVQRVLGILLLDRLQEPAKALPHLKAAAKASPQDADWQLAYARALRASGQMEEAVRYFRKAAELKPRDFWPRYEAANALSNAARYDDALQSYRDALELAPKDSEVRLALAKTLWAAGDIAGAQRAARLILEYDQDNEGARKLLAAEPTPPAPQSPPPAPAKAPVSALEAAIGEAYTRKKPAQFSRAAELIERELARQPGRAKLREVAVDIYENHLRQPAKAIPHLERLVAEKPKSAAWLGVLAKAYAQSGDRERAADAYARVAQALPSDVWSRYELAKLQRELGRRREAEASLRAALTIDPGNKYVRYELARLMQSTGKNGRATQMARELARDYSGDPLGHALLGDLYRQGRNYADAEDEYRAALAADPKDASATAGLLDLRRQRRPEAKVVIYGFEDTDDLRQLGIFTNVSAFLNGRLSASVLANERFFETPGQETRERFETGASLSWNVRTGLQLAAGITTFKTESLDYETGAFAAVYVTPAACVDFWGSFRSADPINDSYRAAREGLSQDVVSAGVNFRPTRQVQASFEASHGEYSDGNTRRFGLASLAWWVPAPARLAPVLRVEYQYLDFADHTSAYSSPDNYTLIRPVLEIAPQLTTWLSLEFHGELPYIFDEEQWGAGLTAGPRFRAGDWLSAGFSYLRYEIPGGQTNWSGQGFKVDVSVRF